MFSELIFNNPKTALSEAETTSRFPWTTSMPAFPLEMIEIVTLEKNATKRINFPRIPGTGNMEVTKNKVWLLQYGFRRELERF